jgi:NAD(P)-dependent dehydrogenase (short-subunit alcohol dehydrogenase family)
MRDRGGSLVAISTAASSAPEVSMSAYTATKAAVDMMVRAAAWELGPFGIRVNSILPGYVPTDSTEGSFTPALSADLLARSALRRNGTPADIAALVVHLSQRGGWITGQVIGVDGGMTVQPMADLTDISRRIYGDAAVDDALGLGSERS